MSKSSLPPTELATVVNWPLLLTASGLGALLLGVPAVLACAALLRRDAAKDAPKAPAVAERAAVAPVAPPARPVASFEAKEAAAPLPVYRPAVRPPLPPEPKPVAARKKPAPDPVLQFDEKPPPAPSFVRRDLLTEASLLRELHRIAREVDLDAEKGTCAELLKEVKKEREARQARAKRERGPQEEAPAHSSPLFALLDKRTDLQGLPFRRGSECQLEPRVARERGQVSVAVRRAPAEPLPYRQEHILSELPRQGSALRIDTLPTVVQMLQVEAFPTRRALVELLDRTPADEATEALARLALFDPTFEVREKAVLALKLRRAAACRSILLDGLRYPWAPVADRAAEALAALGDSDAVADLVALLDEPDPRAPYRRADNKWVVREVVRVNHLRNCLLCHAPSFGRRDPMSGPVPTPGRPLPRAAYYSGGGEAVRADVTYLRQDFSLMEPVDKPDKWPEWQRFDYLVRTRVLTAEEAAEHQKAPPSYPQREAVRFALRRLTGVDAGDDRAAWEGVLRAMGALAERSPK